MFGKRASLTHCEIVNVNNKLHILWSWDQQKGLIFEPLQARLFATLCSHCKDPEPNFIMAQRIYDCKLVKRNNCSQWQFEDDQTIQCMFGENALDLECGKVHLKLTCRQLKNLEDELITCYEEILSKPKQASKFPQVVLSQNPKFTNSQAEPPAPAFVLA